MSDPRELAELSLFEGCDATQLREAGHLLTPIDASPGRVLMVQGGMAKQFVVVETGEVEVVHHGLGGADQLVTLGSGSWVGEIGLLDHVPCTATVRTVDGARVHVAGPPEFRKLLDIEPVARRLRETADARESANRVGDAT
ncbi:MAG: cyclic nucleotide-binding domain-containing protein [Actinobacteria bacterium]|nr:cyclic nucleotide-binding domain-containing protein [Actinomycetota bacterium]